jgi:hypothetical protein
MAIVGKDDHMQNLTCAVIECTSTSTTRGWCNPHYQRWYRHGDPMAGQGAHYASPAEAFAANVKPGANGCMVWIEGRDSAGYGTIYVDGRSVGAHRFAWEQVHGPIPYGMVVDHRCHNPACCNVKHLRLATNKQNLENLKGPRADNLGTGVRGVRKRGTRWEARAMHEGKYHRAGMFDSIEDANKAAIELRNQLFTHNDLDRV